MKIYFGTSISQMDEELKRSCNLILDQLRDLGHTIYHETIVEKNKDYYVAQTDDEAIDLQKELTKMKKASDLIIFEVTKKSIGIGQEIALALTLNKPVIALYKKGNRPHVLRDEGGDRLMLVSYIDSKLREVLVDSIEYASSHQDVRFNFFISPHIGNYLNWISQHKKLPRSVYLRNLIERDMMENKEYQLKGK
jgi:hypothetical protein